MSDSLLVDNIGTIGTLVLILALVVFPYAALVAHKKSKSRITLHMLIASSLLAISTAATVASLAIFHHEFFQARQELGYAIGKSLELLSVYSAAWTVLAAFAYVISGRPEG